MITLKGRHPVSIAIVIAAVCLAALQSCSRPLSDEYFTRTGKTETKGEYPFTIAFGEEECDLDLYVSMVCGNVKFAQFSGLDLSMLWESPEGEKFSEDVFLSKDYLEKGTFFEKKMAAPYRKNLVMDPPGEWKLTISVPIEEVEQYGITGTGVRVTREQQWDTEN